MNILKRNKIIRRIFKNTNTSQIDLIRNHNYVLIMKKITVNKKSMKMNKTKKRLKKNIEVLSLIKKLKELNGIQKKIIYQHKKMRLKSNCIKLIKKENIY